MTKHRSAYNVQREAEKRAAQEAEEKARDAEPWDQHICRCGSMRFEHKVLVDQDGSFVSVCPIALFERQR